MDQKVQLNIRKTCKTCLRVLESRKDLISIFEEDQTCPSNKLKISEMLASVTNLSPFDHDALPKRICITCVCQVRSAYFFKSQAENAHNFLMKHLNISNKTPPSNLKEETSPHETITERTNFQNGQPVMLAESSAEITDVDTFADDMLQDMLVEIEPPQIQEQFNGHIEEEEDSDDLEMPGFEPVYSDDNDEDVEMPSEDPQISQISCENGKSPDSGISDECNKLFSTHFNERQLEESQQSDLRECVCNICHKQMISFKALLRHKRNHHCENKCKYCRRKFGNRSQLKMHTRFKHPQKFEEFQLNGQTNAVVRVEPIITIPECESCGAKFCEVNALRRHHADCDQKCSECGLQIPQKSLYFLHLENEHNIKLDNQPTTLECPFGCLDNFFSEKVLQLHVQQCHPEDRDSIIDTISEDGESVSSEASIECEFCHHRFAKPKSLVQHIAIMHKGTSKDQPKSRNQPKYTRDEFVDKFMVSKSNDVQRCIPCKKEIHRKSLMVHLKGKHASMKSYRCEFCPEGFFRSDYRVRHMSYIHPTQLRCNQCLLQFDRAYKYDAHMSKHGVKAKNFKPEGFDHYDLDSSNMKFIEDISTYDYSKQDMQRRLSILGPTSTQVEIPLAREEFMERYLVSISDKQSHCTICQQKMMKSSILTHLLWKHALKKPLKCAFCNERVVKTNGRLSHMARCHPNEYKCRDCSEQFAKHADLAKHMYDDHNKKLTTIPSSGEEPDIALNEVRFVSQKNEEEVIDETEMICMEPDIRTVLTKDTASVNETAQFKCHTCDKSFTSSKNLKLHNSYKHKPYWAVPKEPLESDSMNFEEFRHNFSEIISDSSIKCLVCDQTLRKRNFPNHAKSRHATTGAYKCAVCPDSFFRPEHRIQHMSQAHRGMFFCQTCNIQFFRNSRYAKHMKDLHEIEMDCTDEYEVDVCMIDLKFVPHVKKSQEDEQNSSLPSIVHEPEPEAADETNSGEGMNRDDFLSEFIKIVNKDSRRCIACEKTMQKTSMYHHLMRYHANAPPFKCPFCDLRLERAALRIRHLQIFHPDDYKCQTCGIQFQKHAHYVDHMMIEHNEVVKTPRAEGEEKDLSTLDIKYLPYLSREDRYWLDDENSISDAPTSIKPKAASTPLPKEDTFLKPKIIPSTSSQNGDNFLKPQIKQEPKVAEFSMEHSIFGSDHPLVEEQSSHALAKATPQTEYNYNDFKSRFLEPYDAGHVKCTVCTKKILKCSVSAHMRLHHAISMCYNCELCPEGFQRSDYRSRHMKFVHENDYKCNYCDIQFYRSVLYKQHMTEYHKMTSDVPELKKRDEIDVPLENMKFVKNSQQDISFKIADSIKKCGRPHQPPINPAAGGLTFKEFISTYIESTGDSLHCKVCGSGTIFTKYNLKRHLKRSHATTQPFFCELCPVGFNKPDDRVQHMSTVHENDFKCIHCNQQFYMSVDYVDHMKEVHRVKIMLKASKNRSEIDVPLERLRFVAEKLCEDTSISMRTAPGVTNKEKNIYDDIVDDALMTRQQFFGKFFRSIKGRLTKCLACTKQFSTNNRLFHALHNHGTSRPYYCEICHKGFFQAIKRMKHISFKHRDAYKCKECSLQFDRGNKYAEHMMNEHKITVEVPTVNDDEIDVPSDKIRFTKKMTSVRVLKQEIKDQENVASGSPLPLFAQGPTKCNDCNKEFDSSRAYRNHLRNKEVCGLPSEVKVIEKPKEEQALELNHQCDICDKKFSAVFALNAHRKFKHFRKTPEDSKKRVSREKTKYQVHCDICEFVSPRRDYVEHHVRQSHDPEFKCRHCLRHISNYNYFLFHLREHHPKAVETLQMSHKCNECKKGFITADHLKIHKDNKHGANASLPKHFCSCCGVAYNSQDALEVHRKNSYHLAVEKIVKIQSVHVPEFTATPKKIKTEPEDAAAMRVKSPTLLEETAKDPIERMFARTLRSEPPAKRARLHSPSTKDSEPTIAVETLLKEQSTPSTSADDKHEYLKFLQCHDGAYKCGICGKIKEVRKHMLHHLKQHKEVVTYNCSQCPESFLFRKKYEAHLKCHELTEDICHSEDVSIDEHPKFQETSKTVANEIKCQICQLTFKLTIMLNRHNSIWHGEENPDKHLTMTDQKAKKEEPTRELAVIKLLKCKHCLEAFIKPLELKEHLKTKHDSESIDQLEIDDSDSDEQDSNKTESFTCEKCKIVFHEKKFLENHQKFFCVYRGRPDQVVNEQ